MCKLQSHRSGRPGLLHFPTSLCKQVCMLKSKSPNFNPQLIYTFLERIVRWDERKYKKNQ